MTRREDETLSIENRIGIINQHYPVDLLVSIHVNSSIKASASGIETLCLDDCLFSSCADFLDAECKSVVHALRKKKYYQSNLLAKTLQIHTIGCAKKRYQNVADRGIKHVVSRLLFGVEVPGALIEVGFLSNKNEASFLHQPHYQELLARGIARGIESFFDKNQSTL